jgi:hypothetical protein
VNILYTFTDNEPVAEPIEPTQQEIAEAIATCPCGPAGCLTCRLLAADLEWSE